MGTEGDIDLWRQIHNDPNVDYAIIHLWPKNWSWVREDNLIEGLDTVRALSTDYINAHARIANDLGKPLVIEEFGYPRDAMALAPGSPVTARDSFYTHIFTMVRDNDLIDGCNFWAWGGDITPLHPNWQPGDPYAGDPAQEPQGLYSVFAADSSTVAIIRRFATGL